MSTPNHMFGRSEFSKMPRRLLRALEKLESKPHLAMPLSDARSGQSSAILVAAELRAEESTLVPRLEQPAASLPSDAEIDFAELKDGTLVELVEDRTNPNRTLLAVWEGGEARLVDRLEQDGQVFVPALRKNEILRQIRLPRDAKPYHSVQTLLSRLESLIAQCVAVDEQHVGVLADFVLSTWFVDRFSVAPYLSVVGLPASGKTTLLRVLSLVCRRSLLITDISAASLYQACTQFMPTILFDETATVTNNRGLRHILRSGTTWDGVAVRQNQSYHAYGAKVVTWLEPPNDAALNSRCIVIPMSESKSTALRRSDHPEIQKLAAELQAQLLQFRFENYKKMQPAPVPGNEVLRPRTRDLLRHLTAAHVDVKRSQRLLQFFESGQCVAAEPLSPEHNAVLRALFSAIHIREDFTSLWISDLTQRVNIFLELAGEKLRLQPRKVGAVLTSMGFSSRTRTNSGWVISLTQRDAEKLHQLAASYGIDGIEGRGEFQIYGIREGIQAVTSDKCSLCLKAGVNKKEPGDQEGMPTSQMTRLGSMRTRIRRPESEQEKQEKRRWAREINADLRREARPLIVSKRK